jgi:type IX secretion system PorP/SprF family membrane protein
MRSIFIFSLTLLSTFSFSQTESLFASYWNNYSLFNPAAAGVENDQYAAINHRFQWTGINGAPISFTANIESKVEDAEGAIGAGYYRESLGITKQNRGYVTYAYHYDINEDAVFSVGTSVLYDRIHFDYDLDPNDPSSPGIRSNGSLNFNLGAYFSMNNFTTGISTTQLRQVRYNDVSIQNLRHYYVMGGYTLEASDFFTMKPSVFIRLTNGLPGTFEINNRIEFAKAFWLGATYRNTSRVGFQAGLLFKERFTLGYAQEITSYGGAGGIIRRLPATHEVFVAVMINGDKD